MVHYGDITKLNGCDLPPVDIIIGGSPCQDLSVAGKRAGLGGERSGLFMEQIRVIKEMRAATGGEYPRLWCGKMCLERYHPMKGRILELSLKKQQESKIQTPLFLDLRKNGQNQEPSWETGGALLGEFTMHSFGESPSVARESHLSQILQGGGAPEILFERQGMSGDSQEGTGEREDVAADFREGTDCASECKPISFQERAGKSGGGKGILIQYDHVGALIANNNQMVLSPLVLNDQGGNIMSVTEDIVSTLRAQEHGHQPIVFEPGAMSRTGGHVYADGVAFTINSRDYKDPQAVAYRVGAFYSKGMLSDNPMAGVKETEVANTLDQNGGAPTSQQGGTAIVQMGCSDTVGALCARNYKGVCNQYVGEDKLIMQGCQTYVVRRLTPLECERLQGYPDGWTDIGEWVDSKGKKHKDADTPRYKALGNSIALPFWEWMAERMVEQFGPSDRLVTMGSLFDGIGGFPLAFSRCKALPVWASEIEEFCVAVTKKHFGEDG